jgi:ABC-type phosphate/phosphonate transport system substrate-binding protein
MGSIMALASLPMYDLPEARPALAALWAAIAADLRAHGITDVPATLAQEQPAGAVWSSPGLLLSQCCGADLVGAWAGRLVPLATPRFRAPGCSGARYASLVVVRQDAPVGALEALRGQIAAINHPASHSGSNALRALIAPLARHGRFFDRVEVSGSHAASLAMVADGAADVAAIDCVSHALLARHRPAALGGTRVLCRSAAAPAPPFVTRAAAGEALIERLRAALCRACAEPALAALRQALLLDGVAILPPSAYRRIPAFARLAARHGYPALR